jgi:ABC-type transport system substrate-binding protein
MSVLRDVLAALEAGRGGVVFLSGEPGIGKSRLTSEARDIAVAAGFADWLEGRAVSYGASLPWWPVRDLLRTWVGVGTQEPELRVRIALRRRLEDLIPGRSVDLQPYLAGVLGLAAEPEGAAALAGLAPEALQFQTYEVLEELVAAMAASHPLVVAIDDLHWADATTLGLLERLLPLAEKAPVLFFFNHRPETGHPSWALRERAAREFRHLVTIIDLAPLDESAEHELLSALVEGALSSEAEKQILAYAEGNPLFLEEMARAAAEGGIAGSISLPTTLEGVILARLDRLEPKWREVLTAASACGRTFSSGLLQAATGAGQEELSESVHHLLRLDLLKEERRWPDASYRFKHALIQDAAYRTLVTSRRRELHARAARWLEERYAEGLERVYGLLAHHWLEADDAAQASSYLRLAGAQALQDWALDEAIGHLRSLVGVLRRTGRESEAASPLFQLASTLHLAMRFQEANDAWEEASTFWKRPKASYDPPKAGFVMGVNRVPWSADPFKGFYSVNLRLSSQLDDALFALRPGPSVEPLLARQLTVSASGLRYRIHLERGLAYNSGRAFNAETVIDGLRVFLRESGDATVLWSIEGSQRYSETGDDSALGIAIVDETTVEIRLARPDPTFPFHLTQPHVGCALPGESTGPFRLVEMTEHSVVIEADPAYPRPRLGNVGRVEWRAGGVEETKARLAGGEIDAVVGYGNYDAEAQTGQADYLGPPLVVVGYFPSWLGPPVDEALRRALALAIDRTALQPLLNTYQQVATGGMVPPGLPGHTPGIAPAFDPDEARRWLATSAHRGPLRAAYYTEAPYPSLQATLDCWRDVLGLQVDGIPISIRDGPEIAKDVQVIQINWVAHVPDPGYFLNELTHSSSRSNMAGIADPDLDRLLERAESASSGPQRMALYHEADRYVVSGRALMIPIFYARMFAILQPWVQGWWEWGNPNQLFSELTVQPASPRAL